MSLYLVQEFICEETHTVTVLTATAPHQLSLEPYTHTLHTFTQQRNNIAQSAHLL